MKAIPLEAVLERYYVAQVYGPPSMTCGTDVSGCRTPSVPPAWMVFAAQVGGLIGRLPRQQQKAVNSRWWAAVVERSLRNERDSAQDEVSNVQGELALLMARQGGHRSAETGRLGGRIGAARKRAKRAQELADRAGVHRLRWESTDAYRFGMAQLEQLWTRVETIDLLIQVLRGVKTNGAGQRSHVTHTMAASAKED